MRSKLSKPSQAETRKSKTKQRNSRDTIISMCSRECSTGPKLSSDAQAEPETQRSRSSLNCFVPHALNNTQRDIRRTSQGPTGRSSPPGHREAAGRLLAAARLRPDLCSICPLAIGLQIVLSHGCISLSFSKPPTRSPDSKPTFGPAVTFTEGSPLQAL